MSLLFYVYKRRGVLKPLRLQSYCLLLIFIEKRERCLSQVRGCRIPSNADKFARTFALYLCPCCFTSANDDRF